LFISQHLVHQPADIGQASVGCGVIGGTVAGPCPGYGHNPFENGRMAISGGILPDILPGITHAITDQFLVFLHKSPY